jgi:HEAT repeat protein
MPDLLAALNDEALQVRLHAALALWKTAESTEGIEVMITSLEDRQLWGLRGALYDPVTGNWSMVRRQDMYSPWWLEIADQCLAALGEMGPKAQNAVPALEFVVQNWSGSAQLAAIRALGKIGPGASSSIPVLQRLASEPDKAVSRAAAEAIEPIRLDRIASGTP